LDYLFAEQITARILAQIFLAVAAIKGQLRGVVYTGKKVVRYFAQVSGTNLDLVTKQSLELQVCLYISIA